MRDWKYRIHNLQKKSMRVVASAACVLGVLAVCLGVVGYRNSLKADPAKPVMTRGVIDDFSQIPSTKISMYDDNKSTYELGTKENPFLILEVVPYREYAEFGYHISGCEPIDIDRIQGNADMINLNKGTTENNGNINAGISEQQNPAYFFEDEPEYKYCNNYWDKVTVEGYYERVEEGKGTFVQDETGKFVKSSDGDIIWHTICDSEKKYDYADVSYVNEGENTEPLVFVGDRVYTYRTYNNDSDSDKLGISYNYYYYKNRDVFLKDTLDLSQKQADEYSIIIKTITPEELNSKPEWANYANLFVVSANSHNSKWVDMWEKYNKYNQQKSNREEEIGFSDTKNKDISAKVVKNMYRQINKDINYAAIVMESAIYDNPSWASKKTVTQDVLDWNLNKVATHSDTGYKNNMTKLAIMLLSMQHNLFEGLYMNGDNSLIDFDDNTNEILFTKESNDEAKKYWTLYTFLPTGPDGNKESNSWYEYWNKSEKWDDYEITGNLTTKHLWVNHRVFSYNNDMTLSSGYDSAEIGADDEDSRYKDFKKYMDEYLKNDENAGKYTDGKDHKATASDAVRYILGYKNTSSTDRGNLKVLDLEPCYDSKNGYSLKESYIRLMIPKFVGDITITHMTTAEFIGSSEDLNSTYNMIFIGTDVGAYNLDAGGKTVWNDSSMNGKIYFHTGDLMEATEWSSNDDTGNRSRSVKFIENHDGKTIENALLRFPGNDITKIKKSELESFLSAGYPIVAMPVVYSTDATAIDQYSNLCSFIKEQRSKEGTTLCNRDEMEKIQTAVSTSRPKVTFEELPKIYDGSTKNESSTEIEHPNYLERDNKGRSLLKFKFTVTDVEAGNTYGCRIYLDQNQDGKFDSSELYYDEDEFTQGERKVTARLARAYSGIVQWKIEVYQTQNKNIRFVETGCSAASNETGIKKKIRVLQIMPKDPNPLSRHFDDDTLKYVDNRPYAGYLNLGDKLYNNENTDLFKKYYQSLADYDISVYTVKVDQNDGNGNQKYKLSYYFNADNKFVYDDSKPISDSNPSASNFKAVHQELFNSYDMIIVGFGDMYGGVNISNEYGAVDFIKYFIAKGKSVLFTHDFTSLHNMSAADFGYSANTLLRDTMGMNRYEAVNVNLSDEEKQRLRDYQSKEKHDTVTDVSGNSLDQKQGFTYYAMKRLGWKRDSNYKNQKMPYKYLITNRYGENVCNASELSKNTGFNNNNDLTTKVTKTNTGQITEYPYKIGSFKDNTFSDTSFSISSTHAQWYQLDMEDPEVTVWYCLADDNKYTAWHDKIGDSISGDSNNPGTAATYGISPNDAANNYYIYSKGNVFYSGVGHSTVTGDMEAKLFINTMIAAYRASYEAPMIEVLNESAKLTSSNDSELNYEMTAMSEYGSDDTEEVDNIEFNPVELNAITTTLSCSIKYDNGAYVKTIYRKGSSTPIQAVEKNGEWVFEDVKNMKAYYFKYEGSNTGKIHFEIWNNKVVKKGKTDLTIDTQNLFLLD